MNKKRENALTLLRRGTLSVLDRSFQLLLFPFLRASSLESYANIGYATLGLFSLLFYGYLWVEGYFSYPLSRSAPVLRFMYRLAVDRLGLDFIPDSIAPVAILPLLAYLSLAPYKPVRLWLGEKFANSIFWLVDRAVTVGEWCIENRWQSLFIIIVLVVVLTVGIYGHFEESSRKRILLRDFDDWLTHVEDFVDKNPVAKPEQASYAHVKKFWREDFESLDQAPGGYHHPAVYLTKMLDMVYENVDDQEWVSNLRDRIADLEGCMEDCRVNSRQDRSDSEAKAWALMNILMGRIYTRLEEEGADDYRELPKALTYFSSVDSSFYKPSSINGRGTVYAHAFSAYISSREPTRAQKLVLKDICPNAYQCALRAFKAYNEAAVGRKQCSFEDKRRTNNIIDLLSRLGMRYGEVVGEVSAPPLEDWVNSPASLANTIRQKIKYLMACNHHEPFLSSFYVTSAQGFGTAAALSMLSGEAPASDVVSAATHLRLANSFEPSSASIWELAYFCPLFKGEDTRARFIDSISQSFDGLPSAKGLSRRIELECR